MGIKVVSIFKFGFSRINLVFSISVLAFSKYASKNIFLSKYFNCLHSFFILPYYHMENIKKIPLYLNVEKYLKLFK